MNASLNWSASHFVQEKENPNPSARTCTLHVTVSTLFHSQRGAVRGGGGAKKQLNAHERARHANMPRICRVSIGHSDEFACEAAPNILFAAVALHIKWNAAFASEFNLCRVLWAHKNKNYEVEDFSFPSSFFFCPASVFNLLKVRTQRALGTGQPTLQMARGSEAVSTLKRAKSRGFSPAGEDTAWIGYFHQPL